LKKKQSSPVLQDHRTSVDGTSIRNRILLSLADDVFAAIRPHLEYLEMPNHLTLHEPDQPMNFVHFQNDGLISLVVVMSGGRTVEAGIVGKEGVAGIPAIAGFQKSPLREIVQISGTGFRVPTPVIRELLRAHASLREILHAYTVLLGLEVAQTAACNRIHNIEQRLARWLLMAQDRVETPTLQLTHDFLATMLGTDRPSVSLAAQSLQRMGAIRYTRGAVHIVNRALLEEVVCECYRQIHTRRTEAWEQWTAAGPALEVAGK
jgi:CRP-like cAMP-binding protein